MPICAAQNGNALFAVAQEIPSSGKEFENASYKIQYHYLNSVKYSGLNLNQYGVVSPCRTICTVCGFVALS